MVPKANFKTLGIFLWLFIIISLQSGVTCEAQAPGPEAGAMLGPVQRIQGAGMIQRAGAPEFHALAEKDPIFLQDLIGTDPNPDTRVWWKGTQAVQADASLGTASALQFMGFSRERGSTQFAGMVPQGITRFRKRLPQTTPPSSFAIFSPTALTAVIPSGDTADFFVEVLDPDKTQITVMNGAVMVKNVNDQLTQQQIVKSCQTVVVERDREPSGVMGVSAGVLRQLVQRTTIPGTLPERVPSCTQITTPPPGPWYPDYLPDQGLIMPYGGDYYDPGTGVGFIPIPPPPPPVTETGTGTGTTTSITTAGKPTGTGTGTGTKTATIQAGTGTGTGTATSNIDTSNIPVVFGTGTGTGAGTGQLPALQLLASRPVQGQVQAQRPRQFKQVQAQALVQLPVQSTPATFLWCSARGQVQA